MGKMRIIAPAALITLLLAWLIAPVLLSSEKKGIGQAVRIPGETMSNAAIVAAAARPETTKGRRIQVTGEVANDPEYDSEGTHFQLYVKDGDQAADLIVDYEANLELTQGDFVEVTGEVTGVFIGVADDDSQVEAARARAEEIWDVEPEAALAPALAVRKTGQTAERRGVVARLDRVEFAKAETRLYITVRNAGDGPIVIQLFNSQILQGDKVFPYRAGPKEYAEMPVDLSPGSAGAGIMVFGPTQGDKALTFNLRLAGHKWEDSLDFKVGPSAAAD